MVHTHPSRQLATFLLSYSVCLCSGKMKAGGLRPEETFPAGTEGAQRGCAALVNPSKEYCLVSTKCMCESISQKYCLVLDTECVCDSQTYQEYCLMNAKHMCDSCESTTKIFLCWTQRMHVTHKSTTEVLSHCWYKTHVRLV